MNISKNLKNNYNNNNAIENSAAFVTSVVFLFTCFQSKQPHQ